MHISKKEDFPLTPNYAQSYRFVKKNAGVFTPAF
jgi:hypothetical protein